MNMALDAEGVDVPLHRQRYVNQRRGIHAVNKEFFAMLTVLRMFSASRRMSLNWGAF